MRLYFLLIIPLLLQKGVFANDPYYFISVNQHREVHVRASFNLLNDTIFIFQRGTTPELPEGEAGFVKNIIVKNDKGMIIPCRYASEGNWILENAEGGNSIQLEYDLLTTHKQYNWDHSGGIDENAFQNSDGLFFTGYTLFIVPGLDMKNITVTFELPPGWKASTPWNKKKDLEFVVDNARFLLNNCFMLGLHKESFISIGGMEMRLAVESKLSYAMPLFEDAMRKIIPFYQKTLGGSPATNYLVAINEERMTDGSAFRRSFSQIFKGAVDKKGFPAWGYIMAHEIFHLWNGHAIIPAVQEEWFKEGFTDYMTVLAMRKTGLIDDQILYRKLENILRRYWLDRVWQRDTVSIRETGNEKAAKRFGVYGGGAIVAIALEIEMRKATNNQKGVATLMNKMFEEFGKTGNPFSLENIISIVNRETGKDLRPFFEQAVNGKTFFDIQPYLMEMGLDVYTVIEEVYISANKSARPEQKLLYQKIFGSD